MWCSNEDWSQVFIYWMGMWLRFFPVESDCSLSGTTCYISEYCPSKAFPKIVLNWFWQRETKKTKHLWQCTWAAVSSEFEQSWSVMDILSGCGTFWGYSIQSIKVALSDTIREILNIAPLFNTTQALTSSLLTIPCHKFRPSSKHFHEVHLLL